MAQGSMDAQKVPHLTSRLLHAGALPGLALPPAAWEVSGLAWRQQLSDTLSNFLSQRLFLACGTHGSSSGEQGRV